MLPFGPIFLLVAAVCPPRLAEWTDVTAVADPELIALAQDFAAVALQETRSDFRPVSVSLEGDKLMVMLSYQYKRTIRNFVVIINQKTWERSYVPWE